MINNLFIFAVALFMVIQGATLATKHATKLARSFRLSQYTVGFIIVAIISILPETFISINAALEGTPSFGLGVLFGSNVADLTIVFGAIVLLAGRSLKVESKIIKKQSVYPFMLLLPLILGLDGHFSRLEGVALITTGALLYYLALKNGADGTPSTNNTSGRYRSLWKLVVSMVILLVGSYFTVTSATALAGDLGVKPILIGMLVVGLGTTMPELFFSLQSVKKRDDALAVGDILGTVLADATVVVGILATINPFSFDPKIIYITGSCMALASFLLFRFMRSGRALTKKEVSVLFIFWLVFVFAEFIANS